MKLNRVHIRMLKRLNVNKKREFLKEVAKAKDLDSMYLDVLHFTDEQVKEAFDKVLNNALEDIKNGG